MRTIFGSRKDRPLAKVCVFLITAALIVGMAGCGPTTRYNLTMAVAGGNGTATDLTNASPYAAGTEVSIKAVAAAGYYFAHWTAPAGTFANANASQTTFTMPAQNVTVTANFAIIGTPVRNWYDLDAIRNNLSGNYTLMNDLDSTTAGYTELVSPTANNGTGWEPIGYYPNGFNGAFDGQRYAIRNLFINRPDDYGVGLFGVVGEGGIVQNIGVIGATVTGSIGVGGLVAENFGTVSNSYSTGSVTGTGNGIFGSSVGGLVGLNLNGGTVSNSYSTGNVTGQAAVGGLVGINDGLGIVNNSYSKCNVSGDEDVGGLVGYNNEGTVSDSFWDIQTSGQTTSDGGTGKTTEEMQNITTFSGAGWNIVAVALNETNPAYIWNIVNDVTYPFLSWEA
jgi:hypothetical protein